MPLARQYLLLVVAATLPLLGAVAAVTYYQFAQERERTLDELRAEVVLLADHLDQLVKVGGSYVLRMQGWAESRLADSTAGFEGPMRDLMPAADALPTGMLDGSAELASERGLGNAWISSRVAERSPLEMREIRMALEMFRIQHLEHQQAAQFQWSYYAPLRNDFNTVYPWVSSQTILEATGFDDIDDLVIVDRGEEMPRWALVGEANNPGRGAVWTHAYTDLLGAGKMVSCLAPVYHDGVLVGSVGTDILLSFLSDFLVRSRPALGQVVLVGADDQILADGSGSAAATEGIAVAGDLLPPEVAAIPRRRAVVNTSDLAGYHTVSIGLTEAPWAIVYHVEETELRLAFLRGLSAYLLLAVLLTSSLILAWYLLNRHYALPAIRLAGFIESFANGDTVKLPRLPKAWKKWFRMVREVYRERNDYLQQLESNAADLEKRIQHRTQELEAANKELDAFAYSVSHDLRAPLRSMQGFSEALSEDFGRDLPSEAHDYLGRISGAAARMDQLIKDLLELSSLSRREMNRNRVDLSTLARSIIDELENEEPERSVDATVGPGLHCFGDTRLLRVALTNLLNNAWKFTAETEGATVEVGQTAVNGSSAFFVRDNGAGFDMRYSSRLFDPFQRLHTGERFDGTGIGLATVQRIVHRHGGKVWGEGKVDEGATFYIVLPQENPDQ